MPGSKSCRNCTLAVSPARVSRILACSLRAYSAPPIRARMVSTLVTLPLLASHLGLSGTKKISRKKRAAGMVSAQNIQRQAICPFHDARVSPSVAPGATGSAICQLASWASRMPITMVNWLSDTNFPRIEAGATSAI